MSKATEILNEITDRVIAEIESGARDWFKEWIVTTDFVSRRTEKPYSFYNQALLRHQRAPAGEFAGFATIKDAGGNIKKGSHGFVILYANRVSKIEQDPKTGKDEKRFFNVLKTHTVFHIETQTDLKPKTAPSKNPLFDFKPEQIAEKLLWLYTKKENGLQLTFGGNQPCYMPTIDKIELPHKRDFIDSAGFYSTAFHEFAHSTGSAKRLNRKDTEKPLGDSLHFGSAAYAREELIAELSAASLMNLCGIETENTFKNSAAYLAGWLAGKLRNDKAFLWKAASAADRAVKYLLGNDKYVLPIILPEDPKEFLLDD